MGDPTNNYSIASIAFRVSGALEPHHHDKVETPLVGDNLQLQIENVTHIPVDAARRTNCSKKNIHVFQFAIGTLILLFTSVRCILFSSDVVSQFGNKFRLTPFLCKVTSYRAVKAA